jgi:hypothetical protein
MKRLALLSCSVLLTLVALELGCRLALGPANLLHWPNLVWSERAAYIARGSDDAYIYDPTLGWALRPNFSSGAFTVDADGFRRTPFRSRDAAPPVLALGGSHVQGDEVADDETWAAYLQDASGRRVINGGVGSYGLDQTLLQAEKIVRFLKPGAIVVGFSGDNVMNLDLSRQWYVDKPYFELRDGALVLRNSPTPPPVTSFEMLPWPQRLFGWSMLAKTVAGERFRKQWYGLEENVQPPGTDRQLVCPILRRLAKLGVPTLAIALVDRNSWEHPEHRGADQRQVALLALHCAHEAGMTTLDFYEPTRKAIEARGIDAIYRQFHYSPEGNRLIARAIADVLP